jgi:hypothetical protein
MTRRSGDDGVVWALFATGGILALACVAAIFLFVLAIVVLRVVATGLSYLGILTLSVLYFHSRDGFKEWLKDKNKNLPSPEGFDLVPYFDDLQHHIVTVALAKQELAAARARQQQAETELADIQKKIKAIHRDASKREKPIPLTTDGRYDGRFSDSLRLNAEWDACLGEIKKQKAVFSRRCDEVNRARERYEAVFSANVSRLPDWRTPYHQGVTLASSASAAQDALLVYGVSFAAAFILQLLFHFNPAPLFIGVIPTFQWFYLPSALATTLSLAVFYVRRLHYVGSLPGVLEQDYFKKWTDIQAYLAKLDETDSKFRAWQAQRQPQKEQKSSNQSSSAKPQTEGVFGSMSAWYEILGVSENATADEIKSAKRHKLQKFHPDKVASLDPNLRAVYERTAMLVNRAYRDAERLGKV